jgi:hypothetical protein
VIGKATTLLRVFLEGEETRGERSEGGKRGRGEERKKRGEKDRKGSLY